MAGGWLRRLFWRVADDLDYLRTLTTLRILDGLAGLLPETPADQLPAKSLATGIGAVVSSSIS
jgi:hypothetical protein